MEVIAMNYCKYILFCLGVIGLGVGCTSSSVQKTYSTGMDALPKSSPVAITSAGSFSGCKAKNIADIRVERRFYGGASHAQAMLKDKARELGGNGVTNYKFWVAPSIWSWAAPKATGTVVKGVYDCMASRAVIQ
jgi:hypothetical protein